MERFVIGKKVHEDNINTIFVCKIFKKIKKNYMKLKVGWMKEYLGGAGRSKDDQIRLCALLKISKN